VKLYEKCVYAILDEDRLLEADQGDLPSNPVLERRQWTGAKSWLEIAAELGEKVPIVFADAKCVHRWLGWGVLTDLALSHTGDSYGETRYRFQGLRPPLEEPRSAFRLVSNNRPLSESHIRSYVQFKTPAFLQGIADDSGPLLSQWLCQPEAVAHVFGASFDDEDRRREANDVLKHAISIIESAAPENWRIWLTPGRIRLVVGDRVVVDLGSRRNEFLFQVGAESGDDDTDEDLPLGELFNKYESAYLRHVSSLQKAPQDDQRYSKLVLGYLRGNPAREWPATPRLTSTDLPELQQVEALVEAFDPTDMRDGRRRVLATLIRRRGQSAFRRELLHAYSGCCAISGWAVEDVLDAAHILPYRGDHTNHVTNGLLLRTDLHALFDLNLLRVDPESHTVLLDARLLDSPYAEFHGRALRLPVDAAQRPSQACLRERFNTNSE
jgi:hypothetical protein